MIRKVISGGQTGVDCAGLDAAINTGIPIGGYTRGYILQKAKSTCNISLQVLEFVAGGMGMPANLISSCNYNDIY